ncbi:MAG: ABC transporter substrate-binding protein [Actinobacteria bacterium]|nr:ABC transporter substrate-binding protein [Actinomycetota bacterium]
MARKSRWLARAMVALLAFSLLATACGDDEGAAAEEAGLTQLTFQLNWVPGGFHAGFAVAKDLGYYEEEGLFVYLVPGNGSGTTAQMAAAGNANIAYADAVAVTQLIAKDAPLVNISTLFQAAPQQVTALAGSGIEKITDIEGKSVAYPTGAAQAPQMPLLFEANNIDVDSVELVGVPRESLVAQLLEGNVDAIMGSMDFFAIQLEDRGAETVNFPFYEYGVPTVSTGIFGNTAWLEDHADIAKAFVRASLKGWAYAIANPEEAVASITKIFPNADAEESLKQLIATIPLYCANGAGYIGKATEEAWANHQLILEQVDSLPVGIDPTRYYTYDYLPADADLTPCPFG